MKLMKLRKGEKGFTMMELLVGISIAAFVTGAAAATVVTMMRLGPDSQNLAISLRQAQNAGYWISQDVQMSSKYIAVGDKQPQFLTMTVPYEAGTNNISTKLITYQFEVMATGEEWLTRSDNSTGGKIAIAEYISKDNDKTNAEYFADNYTLRFNITATSGNMPVTRQYQAAQRVRQ